MALIGIYSGFLSYLLEYARSYLLVECKQLLILSNIFTKKGVDNRLIMCNFWYLTKSNIFR